MFIAFSLRQVLHLSGEVEGKLGADGCSGELGEVFLGDHQLGALLLFPVCGMGKVVYLLFFMNEG